MLRSRTWSGPGAAPCPLTSHPVCCWRGLPCWQTCSGQTSSQIHPGETRPVHPAHCSQLRASVALKQQELSGGFRFSTATPSQLGASLAGRCLSPVSLSKAIFATLPPAEAVAVARGCSEPQGQPLQRLQDPHKDIDLEVSVKPRVLKSLGWGLWPPPKAPSHQIEICRDFKRSFEEPHPVPSSITDRIKTSSSNVTSLETVVDVDS